MKYSPLYFKSIETTYLDNIYELTRPWPLIIVNINFYNKYK